VSDSILRLPAAILVLAVVLLVLGGLPRAARADLPAGSFVFDGDVQHLAHDPVSGATYAAGSFTQELTPTGSGVVADASSGAVDPSTFAHLTGRVSATVADGSGGWYVGGDFVVPAFVGHVSLLHLTSAGQLDTSFNPNPTSSTPFGSSVTAMALSGTTLYLGGSFDSIGGQTRYNLAAIDTTTGNVTAWNPSQSDSGSFRFIEAFALSGSTLYVGGGFSSIGGQSRQNLVAIDTGTAAVLPWNPTADQVVTGLAISGSTVYASGSFATVDGQARIGVAAMDASTGSLRSWDPQLGRFQDAIAVANGTVYVGTSYDEFNDANLHAIDAATGTVQNWHPSITSVGAIRTLMVSGTTLYVGGSFDQVAGAARHNAAAFNVTSGALTAWNPNPGGNVAVLASGTGKVFVGGAFAGAGTPRAAVAHLARLNGSRALDTSFHPVLEAAAGTPYVSAIAVRAGTLYLAGNFASVGGQTRQDLAAIDTAMGTATSWNPGTVTGQVLALAPAGDVVYLGGRSLTGDGQERGGLAALDTQSGELLPWHPSVSGNSAEVHALVVSGAAVYAGGYFTSVGGASRNALAAIDASSGATTAWNPALAS